MSNHAKRQPHHRIPKQLLPQIPQGSQQLVGGVNIRSSKSYDWLNDALLVGAVSIDALRLPTPGGPAEIAFGVRVAGVANPMSPPIDARLLFAGDGLRKFVELATESLEAADALRLEEPDTFAPETGNTGDIQKGEI